MREAALINPLAGFRSYVVRFNEIPHNGKHTSAATSLIKPLLRLVGWLYGHSYEKDIEILN